MDEFQYKNPGAYDRDNAMAQNESEKHKNIATQLLACHLNREMMDIIPAPLFIHDQGGIIFANQAAELFF